MEKEIINYIEINQKQMGKNDFDTFIESHIFFIESFIVKSSSNRDIGRW